MTLFTHYQVDKSSFCSLVTETQCKVNDGGHCKNNIALQYFMKVGLHLNTRPNGFIVLKLVALKNKFFHKFDDCLIK